MRDGSARIALAAAGFDLDSLIHAAARRDFRPVDTGLKADLSVKSALRHIESANVVARLPGSDPALSQQVVLLSAQWDHKGIGPVVNGDSIYNGAEDNASGVAAMLATAEALTRGLGNYADLFPNLAAFHEESVNRIRAAIGDEAYEAARDPQQL